MTNARELQGVSDDELLRRLAELVRRSRRIEAVLVAHIAEADTRRLYIRDAPSMFAYCTNVLHLSEHEAYARITAARASRRHPALLSMLEDGRLHLSGIGKLVPHLTDANAEELLARAAYRTKSEIEELVAAVAPRPDVAPVVRKLPGAMSELGPDRVAAPVVALPLLSIATSSAASDAERAPQDPPRTALQPSAPRPAAVVPLSPARYGVHFTADGKLRDKLARLQALLRCDLASAIEAAVDAKLARVEAKRFGAATAPRSSLGATDTAPRSRYLPAAVRRAVRARDADRCTFRLRDGSRCPERRGLEFHHRDPYARGGAHDPANVCLMCRQHNAHEAELDYGKDHMARYRRGHDLAGADGVRAGDS